MRKKLIFLSFLIAATAVVFSALTNNHALATQPNDDGEHTVTICHRTNSITNPYVKETVDSSSVDGDTSNDNGQGDHLAEHTGPVFDPTNPPPAPHNGDQWGDIIPPFYSDGTADNLPSLNWPDGQSFFDNDCNIPTTPTPTTDPCGDHPESDVCVTPTATPSATPTVTDTPTPTPTPGNSGCTDNCGGSNNNNNSGGGSSSSQPVQAVLAASTMAGTGTFEPTLMNLMLVSGIVVLALGAKSYAKEKRS